MRIAGLCEGESMNRSLSSTARRRVRAVVLGIGIAASLAALPTTMAMAAEEPAWGFEKVTPAGKGAGVVTPLDTFMSSLDGSSLLYSTVGSFDSFPSESIPLYVRYLGSRTPEGWETRGQDVRDLLGKNTTLSGSSRLNIASVVAASFDLAYTMVSSSAALTPGATERGGNLYLRNTKTKALTLIATHPNAMLTDSFQTSLGQLGAKAVSADGRAALFSSPLALVPGAPVPALYSWRAGQGLRVESVLPADEGGGMVTASAGQPSEEGPRDALHYDDALTRVYFGGTPGDTPVGVYMRVGDETKLISRSRIPGDPPTPVSGFVDTVQSDGRYVIFRAVAPLTDSTPTTGETAGARHIYRYDAHDESLTYIGSVSNTSNLSNDIVQVSSDGQTVAFQSTLQLLPEAHSGQMNLYVRHGTTLRLALASEPDSTLGGGAANALPWLSPNGRYLTFTDNSTILSERFGAPNIGVNCPQPFVGGAGPCLQVYVYDAVADELSCASCRHDGQAPLGDAGDPGISSEVRFEHQPGLSRFMSHLGRRASDDGSVLFTSLDGLVAQDTNGAKDVYRWRDGQVQLLSRGLAGHDSRFLDASEDGKTVFFSTSDPIVPTDTDKSLDIYMTRPGAGFTYETADPETPCSGGDCRDATSPPAPLALQGSGGLLGAFDGHDGARSASGKVRVATKATVTGASGLVKVTVSGPGRLSVSGKGLRSAALTVSEAGSYHLSVRLNSGATRSLSRKKRRAVGATVRFVPRVGKPGAGKVALTFKSKSAHAKGR
jgi:hypothetical protein